MNRRRLIDPIAAIIIVLVVGSLEGFLYPVVRNWTVQELTVVRDASGAAEVVLVAGFMHKVRSCKFLGIEAVDSGTGRQLPISFLDARGNDTHTRPVGSQAWGPWRIQIEPSTPALEMSVIHDCHPIWSVKTALGELPIPTKVSQ